MDFEKTLLVDCSKDHYDGGNIIEKMHCDNIPMQ